MKIPAVKKLLSRSVEELKSAENALMEGGNLTFEVEGDDKGEQLTHVLAAIWILEEMNKGVSQSDAIRAFTLKVRNSIE